VQSQMLRPNFRSLAALAIVLVAAAILALVLLTTQLSSAPVAGPAAAPAIPGVVQAAPTVDTNPDSNLPICKRHGGPTC
jgi:hypothetical protein